MALNNFIPKVWAARLLTHLHKVLVYAQAGVINKDYEGQITGAGDTVKINSIGAVTIGSYTKSTSISTPETLTDAQRELKIDQSKYFNFQIDDVDKAQQTPKVMDQAMIEAAYGLRKVQDDFFAGLYTDVAAANFIGSDGSPSVVDTGAKAYEFLVDLSVLLDENDTPEGQRWVIVPAWFHGRLLKDARFVSAGTPATDAVLRNGVVGEAAGFKILKSNSVPNISNAKFKILAGYPGAITGAEQIVSVEAYRPEGFFSDAAKGLHVYGGKVIRPNNLACLVASQS